MRFLEKLFDPHPNLLDLWHAIPLANFQTELARHVEYSVGDVNCLQLVVWRTGNAIKIEKLLDWEEYVCDWVARVVIRLLDDVLLFQKLVRHQLTVVFLEVRKYVRNGVVNRVHGHVADIRLIFLLNHANDLLHERLLHYRHFREQAHLLGVSDPNIGVCVGGCAVRNDERTWVSRIYERIGVDECILRISED